MRRTNIKKDEIGLTDKNAHDSSNDRVAGPEHVSTLMPDTTEVSSRGWKREMGVFSSNVRTEGLVNFKRTM